MPLNYTSLLWFVAIVAAIPAVLWLLKRTPLAGGGGAAGTPRAVAVLPLSAQQKLVTVEVGQGDERLWLVLGVSPQGIRTLHTMAAQTAAPLLDTPTPPPAATFAQLLTRLRGDKSSGGADER
ncbi:MAG: flagellar biosynthetic protein FliO [Rubrivivax sp.]|nr:flagellar biosynthetic protein FliO [Rubrivivax sp.]